MSAPSELPEPGRSHLRRAIADLPTHEPAAELWPRIAAALDAAPVLTQAVTQLPNHQPDDALWDAISARLDDTESAASQNLPATAPTADGVVRRLWLPVATTYRVAALAASVLLVLAVWWGQRTTTTSGGPRETLTYSQEQVTLPASPSDTPTADPLEAEGRAFIDAHCQSLPAVCQSSGFQSLHSQLQELEAEEKGLAQYTRQHGNSPELVQHQVQIATLKATVTRELIRLLIVS